MAETSTLEVLVAEAAAVAAAAPEGCGDEEATDFKDCAEKLKKRVQKCCEKHFAMGGSALKLLMGNIPARLDLENQSDHSGCVEIQLEVKGASKSWNVTVDVDGPTPAPRPQRAHYGYTIYDSTSKTTGHIFLPEGVTPPNVRPWKSSKGQEVYFSDKLDNYTLDGKRFNQYRQASASDDE